MPYLGSYFSIELRVHGRANRSAIKLIALLPIMESLVHCLGCIHGGTYTYYYNCMLMKYPTPNVISLKVVPWISFTAIIMILVPL